MSHLGLFHKAISQSGCVLNTWLYSRHPKEQAKSLAQRVNCPTNSTEAMVKCLKVVDPRDIVRTHIEMTVRKIISRFISEHLLYLIEISPTEVTH